MSLSPNHGDPNLDATDDPDPRPTCDECGEEAERTYPVTLMPVDGVSPSSPESWCPVCIAADEMRLRRRVY